MCQGQCCCRRKASLAQGGAGGRKAVVTAAESRTNRAVYIHTVLPAHRAWQGNKGHIPKGEPQALPPRCQPLLPL